MIFSLFVSCPKGLEYLLEEELRALGLTITRVSPRGVYGEASLAVIYQICLWSRLANRILLILFCGEACNQKMLYQLCHNYAWLDVFHLDKTLAIDFHGTSDEIRNTMFGAQVIKDAIVDKIRDLGNERPTIDKNNPQVRIHAHLKQDEVTVSFDLTGFSLHQRGYRLEAGVAPLKENIAAALLIRAKWPQLADEGYDFFDPFCGSGTLVIEAFMMAAKMAPGLLRDDHAFHHWVHHDQTLWMTIREKAQQHIKPLTIKIQGSDIDERAIRAAVANATRAHITSGVVFEQRALKDVSFTSPKGLLACNPPYGERLSEVEALTPLYKRLGELLFSNHQGWFAAILTSNPLLAKAIGLRAAKQYTLYNGALECKLYCMALDETNQLRDGVYVHKLGENAEMLANRLKKNYAHLQKWAKRNQITCYRVYDADLPEYAFAIDLYHDHVVLQEYKAPTSIPEATAIQRAQDVLQVVPGSLGIPPDHVVMKLRMRQKGVAQYQKIASERRYMQVQEGAAQLNVNLHDYLDTGLFLDHRLLRLRFAKLESGVRFLNCYCYTGTASVHAALAGALTTNIDLSNTYLNWAEENFRLNRLDLSRHQFVQYDCLEWLNLTRDTFDVIFLDPPSFSNSKRMSETLDVQRDHEILINAAMRVLSPGGTLYFSTNFRQFKLSPQVKEQFCVHDISNETIDLDFKRDSKIHQCFMITTHTL